MSLNHANVPLLGHPLTQPGPIPLSPLAAAGLVVLLIALAGWLWSDPQGREGDERPTESWLGPVGPGRAVARGAAVFVLLLAIAAGRLGADDQLRNLAPALIVAVAWPVLLVASAVAGPVWRWLDPWDGIARVVASGKGAPPAADVRWAILPAVAWVWYLTAYADSLQPRAVGAALGAYTLLTVGGALAVGRVSWLSRAEVFGLLFGWAARLRHGLLRAWVPPRGAELVLGVLAGGLTFGLIRASELWRAVAGSALRDGAGALAAAALGAALLWVLSRWESKRGGVTAAAVAVVVGVGAALALARSRLVLAVLLLPRLVSDPFGVGWDLFGTADAALPVDPLTPATRAGLQLGILALAGLVAAGAAGRRVEPRHRLPSLLAAVVPLGLAALAAVDT